MSARSSGVPVAHGERKEVGDGEQDQHHEPDVEGAAEPARGGRETDPLLHDEHERDPDRTHE